MAKFIYLEQKETQIEIIELQLSSAKGGLDLPNIRLYQLACQLRFINEWLIEDPRSVWVDLESSQSSCPLQNLSFVHNSKLSRTLCNSPLVRNALKAWRAIRRLEGRSDITSPLLPILNNPEFLPSTTDLGLIYGLFLVYVGWVT